MINLLLLVGKTMIEPNVEGFFFLSCPSFAPKLGWEDNKMHKSNGKQGTPTPCFTILFHYKLYIRNTHFKKVVFRFHVIPLLAIYSNTV